MSWVIHCSGNIIIIDININRNYINIRMRRWKPGTDHGFRRMSDGLVVVCPGFEKHGSICMSISRRDTLKGSLVSAASLLLAQPNQIFAGNSDRQLELSAAGYAYNHVQAFITGKVEVEGCTTEFEIDTVGKMNTHIFSGPQTRAVTEVGLGPFMLAYANDNFRDYSLIPVFPLRTFRHRSIFVHSDAGIENIRGR